ncbi:MAG: hypothetical protein KQH67_12430 [Bacteroidetes bacterium]|nr:hypothetical protein [Bacteroidota bacterium]
MKTKNTILIALALILALSLNAQIAINTDGSAPDASTVLDMQSIDRGTSFPNLNISDMSTAAPVTSPKTGLIAYNTNSTTGPGLVMWTGTQWVVFELEGTNWSLLGNANTDPSTNFLGTTDEESLVIKTNGTERMRFLSDGRVSVNTDSPWSGTTFYTLSSGDNDGIASNANGTGAAVYSQNSGNGNAVSAYVYGSGLAINGYNAGSGSGVYGRADNSTAFGVRANNDNATGTGLVASGNDYSASYLPTGSGIAGAGADGIYGKGRDSDGTGIIGVGNNGSNAYYANSGSGGAFTGYHGIISTGRNTTNGIGVIGLGNDSTVFHFVPGGNGGAFTGEKAGVYGYATNTTEGTGVVGVGNRNVNYSILTGIGSGGAFSSDVCGVYGYASKSSGTRYGGYFVANGGAYAYVGYNNGGTLQKIIGAGAVSTIVKDLNEENVTMYCPEAPEVLFQDYGIGQLTNGKTHITLDPVLVKNIYVDEDHPMKVFVTLEGDCNGIYITNKSASGFDVIELQGGTSNITFSWQIVATRANEKFIQKNGSVEISDYSKRFPPAPGPINASVKKDAAQKINGKQQKEFEIKDAEKDDKVREE